MDHSNPKVIVRRSYTVFDPAPKRIVVKPKPKKKIIVGPSKDPYWKEKGWRKHAKNYSGYFRVGQQQWKGLIEVNDAWGHPISYQTQGAGNFPLLRSAGPDGIFGNADDILSSEM